jgi:hypothetical protein
MPRNAPNCPVWTTAQKASTQNANHPASLYVKDGQTTAVTQINEIKSTHPDFA